MRSLMWASASRRPGDVIPPGPGVFLHAARSYALRFAVLYGLLQWVPLFLQIGTSFAHLTWGWITAPPVWGLMNRAVGQWTILNVLRLPEHSPPRFGGDSLALFLGMVTLAVASAVGAGVWWLADRSRPRPALFVWSHTCLRFMLATMMLAYGWHKILPAQFPFTFDYFTLELGQHPPRDLLWAFMSASREYQVFAGVVEVAGGLLLLARRTTLLGAAISTVGMGNVLAMNLAYDVGVKFLAAQMFLMALATLLPFAEPLYNLFITGRGTNPARIQMPSQRAGVMRSAGVFFGVWITSATFVGAQRQVDANAAATQTPLYGIWDVEEVSRNGNAVPLLWPNTSLWRRLVVQSASAAVVIPLSNSIPDGSTARNARRYRVTLDTTAQTVTLAPFAFTDTKETLTFTYARPTHDQLAFTGQDEQNKTVAMRFRRVDPSTYTLVNWERGWFW